MAWDLAHPRWNRRLTIYAVINGAIYVATTAVAVVTASAFLLSFVVLLIFALPVLIAVIVVTASRYRQSHLLLDKRLLTAAVFILLAQVVYFVYGALRLTQTLWDNGDGFYLSDNDVLHVGMALWIFYVFFALRNTLTDKR